MPTRQFPHHKNIKITNGNFMFYNVVVPGLRNLSEKDNGFF